MLQYSYNITIFYNIEVSLVEGKIRELSGKERDHQVPGKSF